MTVMQYIVVVASRGRGTAPANDVDTVDEGYESG